MTATARRSQSITDYSEIKAKLLAERREVEEGLNDNAQLWEVSEVRDGLDNASADGLNQTDQALARIDAGDDGLCDSCAKPIGKPRLEALPYVTLCIDCAEAAPELAK